MSSVCYAMLLFCDIIGAAIATLKCGVTFKPQLLLPFATHYREVDILVPLIRAACDEVCKAEGFSVDYAIGCAVETPSGCFYMDRIAKVPGVDFISMSCCDITALTLGAGHDESKSYMVSK
jgi:pyruvate,orthophosphate dikinase